MQQAIQDLCIIKPLKIDSAFSVLYRVVSLTQANHHTSLFASLWYIKKLLPLSKIGLFFSKMRGLLAVLWQGRQKDSVMEGRVT